MIPPFFIFQLPPELLRNIMVKKGNSIDSLRKWIIRKQPDAEELRNVMIINNLNLNYWLFFKQKIEIYTMHAGHNAV